MQGDRVLESGEGELTVRLEAEIVKRATAQKSRFRLLQGKKGGAAAIEALEIAVNSSATSRKSIVTGVACVRFQATPVRLYHSRK